MPRGKVAGRRATVASISQSTKSSKGVKAKKKSAPAEGGLKERKKMRFRPGTVALREIKRY